MTPKHIKVVWDFPDIVHEQSETFYENRICEKCEVKGAYVLDCDPNSGALCLRHIEEFYGEYELFWK